MERACRSDEDTSKSQLNELDPDYRLIRGGVRQCGDERDQERTILYHRKNHYEDDGTDRDDILPRSGGTRYISAKVGICAVCRETVGGASAPGSNNNAAFEQARSCDQGHIMCQRCVQRFAIRSDMGCVLCRTDSQHSNSSDSRDSNSSSTGLQAHNPRNEMIDEQRSAKMRSNDFHGVPWARTHSEAPVIGTRPANRVHSTKKFNSYFCEWDSKIEAADPREPEVVPNEGWRNQQRSYCSIIGKEIGATPSETRVNGQILTECSRRPIRCPRLDCAVNVAFSALTHHFLFDHPDVPILSVEPGVKSTLIVSFAGLSCDSSRCLALLLVSGKLSGPASRLFNGNQIHPKYRNRLPLPVLAARLHCASRYANPNEVRASGEGYGGGDVIIAWVAGMDIGNVTAGSLRCSIQAVDNVENESVRSLTYTGPVNSLRTAQRPREVFLTGDCVILHEGLINNITSDCMTLNVNVIVH